MNAKALKRFLEAMALQGLTAAVNGAEIIGIRDTASNFTATEVEGALAEIIADLAATTTGLGASTVGLFDTAGNITGTNVETGMAELALHNLSAQRFLNIPIQTWQEADGTALAVHAAAPTPGYNATAEAMGIRWATHANPDPIGVSVPIPPDLDASSDVIVHVLAYKTGATSGDTVDWLIEAFNNPDAALFDADADFGGTASSMTGAATAKTLQEETLTLAAANVAASPCVLQLTLQPTDGKLGTDDVVVVGVWLEYTGSLLTS